MSKSHPPLCRYCGKVISKKTKAILFGSGRDSDHSFYAESRERPKSREDAQRLTNLQIVSVRYTGTGEDRYVSRAAAWDGTSYVSDYFCKSEHAAEFAVAVVQHPSFNLVFPAYEKARKALINNGSE